MQLLFFKLLYQSIIMNEEFKLVSLPHEDAAVAPGFLNQETARTVRDFHKSFPMYAPTPLTRLKDTANCLGLGEIFVKDESFRFGLNAFKVLGGSFAIGSYLTERLGMDVSQADYAFLTNPGTKRRLGEITFVTATDGNHGRGVAWTAARFGHRSVVYMPKGSARERLENIRAAGAEASVTDLNYDDTVRLARRQAEERGWVLVQDTSWDGYEDVPTHIMQGYCTMGMEACEQLPEIPTHVFLQAGVGSMAGAVAGLFASVYGKDRPVVVIVEPDKADCVFRTARANDGRLRRVTGDMDTIMAGLACGEPCGVAWDVLRSHADFFISFPDYAAAKGMRILSSPAGRDSRVISGESGASAFGCVAEIMMNPELAPIREKLGLDKNSRVLFFSTEGATDRENYRAVVWDGKYPGFG